ncbi:hypothetical protein EMIHUDRAFT_467388 [Emiliania huxleyi CCMP1516]|uniref:Glutaredoxin domain-containing protein n=2 Tax=Emiliania huxleyi TaxID=2903 RepID=A0A0D3J9K2_EMIH1|nr:hypothetical protein EMIHUDRAFT_470006 [Emiliania huxleyi CCMP1516]XP_005788084.1 hypothetical protein EMIHUDRAFT_467388 [Emiliania huxleyi CCMP1516]EOD20187.1 hypothetical protein EMIHUDRAFT_470006 [Emiliania huxleyi CCMP1516]EOD35655.1 hypothetical protein EMIHUDRAFT_467388 [Emiliania huxleyi CCMP1516]|mmetsp:Transcript_38420/g.127252  ORF Transcript_38420/g.127252 Transcript_38420/m.127252 type:complete len:222 (+) Transcript_38420:128-793(+)|eukprot:XP_005772616.1 hypothetical protein EMIHUDRAFT_470006 [Emiliania huxleyi CCMP1516]
MCVTLLLAVAGALALRPGVHVCRSSRGGDVSMKILRHQAGASADSTSAALDRLCGAPSGVFVLSYTEAGALSNSLLERVVADFEASELYGGPALACAQIVRDGGGPQDALCDQRGVTVFPTTEVWQKGALVATVGAFELEATLRGLGLRTAATSTWSNAAKGSDAKGLPSATAVDDIDFTGGGGEGGRPIDMGRRGDRGITQDYFPFGDTDKPGDEMGDAK